MIQEPERTIDSAAKLYKKLERTFFRRPAYGSDQVDWVFDVAVTAWHLVDWVARERGEEHRAVQLAMKEKCPGLIVCEQVCNGAKHRVLDKKNLKPFSVERDVRITDDLTGVTTSFLPGTDAVEVVLTPAVAVTDKDGRPWDATAVFHEMLRFWARELGQPAP